MEALFGMVGLIGLIVTIILYIIKKGSRKRLKKFIIGFSISFIIGVVLTDTENVKNDNKKIVNETEIKEEIVEKPDENVQKIDEKSELKFVNDNNKVKENLDENIKEETMTKEKVEDSKNIQKEIDEIGNKIFGDNYRQTIINWDYDNMIYTEKGDIDEKKSKINHINTEVKLSDGLTQNLMIKSFLLDVSSFLKETKYMDYNTIFIGAKADFFDKFGNSTEYYAVKMDFNKDNVDKINFEKFNFKSLPDIAEVFYLDKSIDYKYK